MTERLKPAIKENFYLHSDKVAPPQFIWDFTPQSKTTKYQSNHKHIYIMFWLKLKKNLKIRRVIEREVDLKKVERLEQRLEIKMVYQQKNFTTYLTINQNKVSVQDIIYISWFWHSVNVESTRQTLILKWPNLERMCGQNVNKMNDIGIKL